MANKTRSGRSRPPATQPNSAATGVILVVAAVVLALLLFNAGGSDDVSTGGGDETQNEDGATTSSTTSSTVLSTTFPPGNLEVVAANGSGVPGRAKDTASKLTTVGYTNITAVDGNQTASTIIYYAPAHEADAKVLARVMNLPEDRAQPIPAVSPLKTPVPTAMLVVLIGADFDPATATLVPPTVDTN